jgi:hypothetical protein
MGVRKSTHIPHALPGCPCPYRGPWVGRLDGESWEVYVPHCRPELWYPDTYETAAEVLGLSWGRRVIRRADAEYLLRAHARSPYWFRSKAKRLAELGSVFHSARSVWHLLRDVLRIIGPPRRCYMCNRRVLPFLCDPAELRAHGKAAKKVWRRQWGRPHHEAPGWPQDQALPPARFQFVCSSQCCLDFLTDQERFYRWRLNERRRLARCRLQLKAARQFLRTGNPEALRSLPEGFGPAGTSPT